MVQRDVRDYLQDILQYIAIAERLTDGITFEAFETERYELHDGVIVIQV